MTFRVGVARTAAVFRITRLLNATIEALIPKGLMFTPGRAVSSDSNGKEVQQSERWRAAVCCKAPLHAHRRANRPSGREYN